MPVMELNKKMVKKSDGIVDKRRDTAIQIANNVLKIENYKEEVGFTWIKLRADSWCVLAIFPQTYEKTILTNTFNASGMLSTPSNLEK